MSTTPSHSEWIALVEARRRFGLGQSALAHLIAVGAVGVRRIPGSKPRVSAPDLERVVERATTPARTSDGPGRAA